MRAESSQKKGLHISTVNHAKKILLVEDDDAIQLALQELLEQEGYTVQVASNGQNALNLLAHEEVLPNLILLDLFMPIMDGWQFFDEFKQNEEWLKKVPVVIMSAAGQATIGSITTRAKGVAHIIKKPFELNQLLSVVQQYG